MRLIISSPSKAYIKEYNSNDIDTLRSLLSYTNTANQHTLKRHHANVWYKQKYPDSWQKKAEELKAIIHNTLLFEENGEYFIRPGSMAYIKDKIQFEEENQIIYPEPKKVPWAKPLPFDLYPYQGESTEELIKIMHGNVELCTGSGKSPILLNICRETGFRTAIIAPSESIFHELLEKFEYHLGKNNVGTFGDGKKKIGKRFTVCIGDSLCNIKPGTKEWEFFSGLDMLAVDESHTWGADSLDRICHGILQNVPYRLFFSGTQTRGDGAVKLLQSIVGPTVHTLTTKEAIAGGYICNHDYTIVDIESSNPNQNSQDVIEQKRIHLLRNRNIATFIAKLANADAITNGRQTLVLVEELGQISMLLPLLKVPYVYAHSDKNAAKLTPLGLIKVDKAESIEKFNKNEAQILIGTSCISVGCNIYPTHNCVNWVGGSSEIRTKQGAVGRCVRRHDQNPWKDRCVPKTLARIFDFNILDQYVLKNSLEDRILYYRDSGTSIRRIKLK
jgi:superfamily II DNA or RNA helicase